MQGWIKLYRQLSENKLWTCEPFSRGQAWVDLLLIANHEYGYFYLRDHKIEVQRGQVGWSELKLSQRWMWSRNKVRKFINDLEKEQQVIQQKSHSTSIITILNYETYQQKEQQEDNSETTERQQKDTNKNNKEENKNDKNIEARKKIFFNSLLPYVKKYNKEMLRKFYDYWAEPTHNQKKLRYELEKTWSVSHRLNTWHSRQKQTPQKQQKQEHIPTYPRLEEVYAGMELKKL